MNLMIVLDLSYFFDWILVIASIGAIVISIPLLVEFTP